MRFTASILKGHEEVLSRVVAGVNGDGLVRVAPGDLEALQRLAGALNAAASAGAPPPPPQGGVLLGTIGNMDYARRVFAPEAGQVVAYAFTMPSAGCYMSAANYAGDPWLRTVSVSETLGDMEGKVRSGPGKTATLWLDAGTFPPGTLLYANQRIDEPAPPGTTGSCFSIVW